MHRDPYECWRRRVCGVSGGVVCWVRVSVMGFGFDFSCDGRFFLFEFRWGMILFFSIDCCGCFGFASMGVDLSFSGDGVFVCLCASGR